MISERIFIGKVTIDEIINMLLDQTIDFIFQQFYSEDKVNTATSVGKGVDVA